MRKYTDKEFVAAWMTHATISEVADALGSTYRAVTQRATRLRKMGVKIPSKRIRSAVDVAALNALVETCRSPTFTGAGDTRVPEGESKLMDGPEMMPWTPEDSDE